MKTNQKTKIKLNAKTLFVFKNRRLSLGAETSSTCPTTVVTTDTTTSVGTTTTSVMF